MKGHSADWRSLRDKLLRSLSAQTKPWILSERWATVKLATEETSESGFLPSSPKQGPWATTNIYVYSAFAEMAK